MKFLYVFSESSKFLIGSLLLLVFMIQSSFVYAEDGSPHNLSANVTLTSDYVYRGITQTNEDPALQGGFDYSHESGFYLGVWASNLEFNSRSEDAASIEIDVYGGLAGEFQNGVAWDVGALYYFYPDQDEDNGADYDFGELYGSLSYGWDVEYQPLADIGVAYSSDFYGEDGDAIWIHGGIGISIMDAIDPYLRVGYQDVEGDKSSAGFDYFYYAIGMSKTVDILTFDLSWHDASEYCGDDDDACEAIVFSISSNW